MMVLQGCSASCKDACQNVHDCAQKLLGSTQGLGSVDECATNCENAKKNDTSCPADKQQETIDCIADMKCDSLQQFATDAQACDKCPKS
ncbi:MAG: hypothetical protein ACK4N5_07580 [Myxococcales bacterium]